ncbi:hypothetical protein AKG07_05325 [Microbacterium sp. CGR1]|uniref:DUF262 domain-containing protein n=1 Tax=Microbacterium sp. CGR1 TaxID=1696072 RepID=UPI00069EB2EC|nr:DUF262 domain-containing protein [Microbacterium sp. CGR1]AKV85804.1 hypothetical protein AKG07_05325 [Microbacterium sp. CGR1]
MPTLDPAPRSIQSVYNWHAAGELFVNRRYQRKLVWTQVEKQKLIESIQNQYPVPAILLAERDEGGYEIIDGLQRLSTIISFIENGFSALDGRFFDISHFTGAQVRVDEGLVETKQDAEKLSQREVGTFLDYVMAITVMRDASEAEIDDVFQRINTYGHRLSDQERRQSGVQNEFATTVRELATTMRGDVSTDVLPLSEMPSISIDLPMTKHGYRVQAEDVFWVKHGILRSTDLRDSLDEQYIADILASVAGGTIVERSKAALDEIYDAGSTESTRVEDALQVYGADTFSDEFKFCIDEIEKVCSTGLNTKLRDLLFTSPNTNGFPSVFAILFFAFHELLVKGNNVVADYAGLKTGLTGMAVHVSAKATSTEKRVQKVNLVKGLIQPHLVPGKATNIYGSQAVADIDGLIQRSQIELPHYELKQGLLTLAPTGRGLDAGMIPKLVRTICAIANNGPTAGAIVLGVADKSSDADKIKSLDGTEPRRVGPRYVVGVDREAAFLGEQVEDYFSRIKDGIRNSSLSEPLKSDVLASIDYNNYYGLGVIVIGVPPQRGPASVGTEFYFRSADQTMQAAGADIVAITQRF